MSIVEDIVISARLAATQGANSRERIVRESLVQGYFAAQHNHLIPLPVLLDVLTIMESPEGMPPRRTPAFYSNERGYDEIRRYDDEWLLGFHANVRRSLGSHTKLQRSEHAFSQYFPLLMSAWPGTIPRNVPITTFAKAFNSLLDDDKLIQRILDAWKGKRQISLEQWNYWFPGKLAYSSPSYESGIWGNFATGKSLLGLHERFDHMAADMYMESEDIGMSSRQQHRIKLLLRRQKAANTPLPTSYEEQDPFRGAISLSTLVQDEYGDFKMVNQIDPRISNFPPSFPTQLIKIHLCWAAAHKGVAQNFFTPQANNINGSIKISAASILQGFIALVLDDWRNALAELPVEFFAHNNRPNAFEDMGAGGERWKQQAKLHKRMPPSNFVSCFFTRTNWMEVTYEFLWQGSRRYSEWWCACLLEDDLEEFGFTRQSHSTTFAKDSQIEVRKPLWVSNEKSFPDFIDRVILLNPANQTGKICLVIREKPGLVKLSQLNATSETKRAKRPSYLNLRTAALDVLLDVLESTYL